MHYSAFGLVFESEIEVPALQSVPPTPPDVHIQIGEIPEEIDPILGDGVLYQLNKSQFRLHIPDVASYYVEDGSQVIVEPNDEADDESIHLFLLGSTMAAIFHQRGLLPLHASAVETDQGAVIFCGISGVGKSTLALALKQRGYHIISDDISVIKQNEDTFNVLPGYPQQKLWANILDLMDISTDGLKRVRPKFEKYNMVIAEGFTPEATPLHRIYILNTANNVDSPQLSPIEGLAKLNPLVNHTYRRQYLIQMQEGNRHSPLLMQMMAATPMMRMVRPDDLSQLDTFVDLIEEDFSQ